MSVPVTSNLWFPLLYLGIGIDLTLFCFVLFCFSSSVDGTPIRELKNMESRGVPFPKSQPMRIYSSLWNADDWATRGDLVKQTGFKLLSQLLTGTSMPVLVFGPMEHLLVIPILNLLPRVTMHGSLKSLILPAKKG